MSTSSDAATVFTAAKGSFLASLSPDEQAQFRKCMTITELLDSLRELSQFKKSGSRMERCLQMINSFGDKLSPYFKVMEIVFAAHPEWANIAFGSLRLVLQLASHFTTFFEKLCRIIESLAARLPRYEELYNSLAADGGQINPRLKESLQSFYVTLFQFFEAVARVFSNKHGKIKRSPQVVADLLWKPFDLRFQLVLQKIDFHHDIVKEELEASHLHSISKDLKALAQSTETGMTSLGRKLEESLQRIERSFNDQTQSLFLNSVMQWISAPDYASQLERAQQERTEGTTEWLHSDGTFKGWKDSRGGNRDQTASRLLDSSLERVLWISGNPGCGKTVLASSIIHTIDEWCTQHDGFPPTICYYFFTKSILDHESISGAFRAIAAQIFGQFQQSEKVHNIFSLATHRTTTVLKASPEELIDAISQCLPHLPNLYFVFDGFDECADPDLLLKKLRYWCLASPLKAIIFSRPNVASLQKISNQLSKIDLTRDILHDPLTIFAGEVIGDLSEDGFLPVDMEPQKAIQHIVDRAEGMFLWVRLMANYLRSPAMTKLQRLNTIMEEDSPELDRLDEMYRRIHTRILSMDTYSVDLAHKALLWVAGSPLSSMELREAVYPDGWDGDDEGKTDQFDRTVILCSCGLLEKDHRDIFRYIHLTALQFAHNGSPVRPSSPPLIPDISVRNATQALRCLSYLTSKVPEGPLSGEMGLNTHPDKLNTRYPLLRFAALNWLWLLIKTLQTHSTASDSPTFTSVLYLADKYFESQLKIMTWVEAFYIFRAYVDSLTFQEESKMVAELSQSSQVDNVSLLVSTIKDFLAEITVIISNWSVTLSRNPTEIWGDITLFVDSRFLRRSKAGTTESLAPRLQREAEDGRSETIKPTFSVAMSSADAYQLATINVYPANPFLDGWKLHREIPSRHGSSSNQRENGARLHTCPETQYDLLKASSGWMATFDIYDISCSPAKSLYFASIALIPKEVAICLCQSLRFSPLCHWKCDFPMTIAPNLRSFTILNRLFHVRGAEVNINDSSTIIPVDTLRTHWSLGRPYHDFVHRYHIAWSPDSRQLTFTDDGRTPSGQKCDSILLLRIEPTTIALRLVKQYSVLDNHHAPIYGQFHPSRDAYMFLKGKSLHLWDVSEAYSKPIEFCEIPGTLDPLDAWIIQVAHFPKVSFSHCGAYIAIVQSGRPWPSLIPLPPWCRASHKRKLSIDSSSDTNGKSKKVVQSRKNDGMRRQSISSDDELPAFTGSELLRSGNGDKIEATFLHNSGHSRQLIVCQADQEKSVQVPVINLPNYMPTELSGTVALPTQQEGVGNEIPPGFLTLVLSPAPLGAYASDEAPLSTHLPTIIRKDIRALPGVLNISNATGKRSLGSTDHP